MGKTRFCSYLSCTSRYNLLGMVHMYIYVCRADGQSSGGGAFGTTLEYAVLSHQV